MTLTKLSRELSRLAWRRQSGLAAVLTLALVLALSPDTALAQTSTTSQSKNDLTSGALARGAAIFLGISLVGGYLWYFGLFPRLLRKANPKWPLDAWRVSSYCAWITICVAVYAGFRKPLVLKVVDPLFRSFPGNLSTWAVELIFLPLMMLVGLLVIWNFRRDVTNRVRPG